MASDINEIAEQVETALNHLPERMDPEQLCALFATIAHGYGLRPDHLWPICFEAWRAMRGMEQGETNVH